MWRKEWANSIPIYIHQDAKLYSLFISGNCSIYFRWYVHPSSGAHTTVSTASGICHTVTSICRYRRRVGIGLSVLWVAYATHSTLKPRWKLRLAPVKSIPVAVVSVGVRRPWMGWSRVYIVTNQTAGVKFASEAIWRYRLAILFQTRATLLLPYGFGIVDSRFFSVSLKVLSQVHLRRRSLQSPRSATAGWLNEHNT
jgi:hypothetical protein